MMVWFWFDVIFTSVNFRSASNIYGEDNGVVDRIKCCNVCVVLGRAVSGFSALFWSVLNVSVRFAGISVGSVSAVGSLQCRTRLFCLLLGVSGLNRVPAFSHSPYGLPFLSSSFAVLHSFHGLFYHMQNTSPLNIHIGRLL